MSRTSPSPSAASASTSSSTALVRVEKTKGGEIGQEERKGCWASCWPPSTITLIKLGVLGVIVVLLVLAFTVFRIQDQFGVILEWVENNKLAGAFAFAALYAVCVVLFVPGAILSLGAGLVFGVWQGALVVWVGATVGQTIAFPIGRFLLRDLIAAKTAKWQAWQAVETAIKDEAWKIVLLLRLAPVVPYSALNYALGLTSVGFLPYAVASCFGILPGTFLYTYFGSLATDITSIVKGEADIDPTATIVTAVVSGVVIVAVIVIITIYAKRALRRKLEGVEQKEADTTDELEAQQPGVVADVNE